MDSLASNFESKWLAVDMSFLAQLWQIYRTDATVHACASLIKSRLNGLGVMYLNEDSGRVPTKSFFDHITQHYGAFCNEALDQLMVQGFCAYTLPPPRRGRNADPAAPSTVPFGRGRYVMRYDAYDRPALGLIRNNGASGVDTKPDPKVFFMVLSPPDVGGRPVSPVASAYSVQALKRQIEMNTMMADRVLARPPVLTQNKTDQTFDERDLIGMSSVEPDVAAGRERQNLLRRNKMNVEVWKQQTQLMRFLNQSGIDSSSSAWQNRIDPVTGLPVFSVDDDDAYQPSFIPLPSDAVVAAMPLPQRPPDFVQAERLVFEHTCMCMGVTPTMVAGAGSAQNASSGVLKLSDATLFYSILRYRNALTHALLDVYAVVFGNGDSSGVQVVFPAAQRPEAMLELFERGIVSYDYFIMEYCRYYGLPKSAFTSEEHIRARAPAAQPDGARPTKPPPPEEAAPDPAPDEENVVRKRPRESEQE